ncbi:MAG: helicase-related protein [Candidatus Nanoarchaeia archaeon]|nr:helicase-related protein [Candidatus Nanoarchaeia archaeon]
MLKAFNPRKYQLELYENSINQNTLIVLPTGLGKTAIAMLLAAKRLIDFPNNKILFLAPTKPLVEQQMNSFKKQFLFSEDNFNLFTGLISPEKRKELYQKTKFIFSTPQTIENDVISGNIDLECVSLIVFDEAHRATGNYAYVFLAQKYIEISKNPLILALSASPGSQKEEIEQICKNLFIENVQYKSSNDESLKEYSQKTDLIWKEIELTPNINKAIAYLNKCVTIRKNKLSDLGFKKTSFNTNLDILNAQKEIQSSIAQGKTDYNALIAMSVLAELIKLNHSLELIESQSLFAANQYISGIFSKSKISKAKSIQNLVKDVNFISAIATIRDAINNNEIHPKIIFLKKEIASILSQTPNSKIIIFTQFRDTATNIKEELGTLGSANIFFGQAKKNGVGFSQKQQKEILEDFTNNKFQILIATSVAEEGLDIPSVNHVFFYEPIPSAIRSVQRRGRTGRHSKGNVTILISKGTRDEAYRWASFNKEKNMFKVLKDFSTTPEKTPQKSLTSYVQQTNLTMYVDHREKGSNLVKTLLSQNIDLKLKQLAVGDFLISSDVVVEFKNVRDFVDSIVDGRLLTQLKSLIQYSKPLILIEGEENIYSIRNVDPLAIDGMLATIYLSYKIPLFRTKNSEESARLLIAFAKKEQENKNSSFTFHSAKPMDDNSLQEYIVSSFPAIGGALAKKIMSHFKTLSSFFNSSKEELVQIDQLGEKKANEILRIRNLNYGSNSK